MNTKAAILISSLAITVSAFAQSRAPEVSSEKTDALIQQFGATDESDQKRWKEFVSQQTASSRDDSSIVSWIQPSNRKTACKVFAQVPKSETPWWTNPDNRIYWDGDCRDGYAHGIGREFNVVKGEISSWLAEYDGGESEPFYHLVVFYDRQAVTFAAKAHPYYVKWGYFVEQGQAGKRLVLRQDLIDASRDRLYQKFIAPGEDGSHKGMTLPNTNKYLISYNANPANAYALYSLTNGKNERVGYSIGIVDNGIARQVRQFHHANGRDEVVGALPESYRRHLTDVARIIDANLGVGEKLIQESYVAISKYKRRICKGDVRVEFVDDEIYGRICLDNGELAPFAELIANSVAQQEKRHAKAREDIDRQKRDVARRQATQVEQQSSRQNASPPDTSGFAQAVNEFAQGMASFHQNAANFTSSFMNSFPSQSGGFGGSGGIRTNCVRVSNTVHCRTQ